MNNSELIKELDYLREIALSKIVCPPCFDEQAKVEKAYKDIRDYLQQDTNNENGRHH